MIERAQKLAVKQIKINPTIDQMAFNRREEKPMPKAEKGES